MNTRILLFIIEAQFCGTSLWFAGNAVLPQLMVEYHWQTDSLGYLTTAVQLGFIVGTLLFAVLGITDRFSPSRVFFVCCLFGAAVSLAALFNLASFGWVLSTRFAVGFFLAGIYPVGMKIAVDWKKEGLGHWLGLLVGALVLGTAFPHLLRAFPVVEDVRFVFLTVAALAVFGGVIILFGVHDGPYRKRGAAFSFRAVMNTFRISAFRRPTLGYFGHMWELYAFWAFVPFIIAHYSVNNTTLIHNSSMLAFFVIAAGAVSCWFGGSISRKYGSRNVALYSLVVSGACCCVSPFVFDISFPLFVVFLLIWGAAVVADSPQFSSLVSLSAPAEMRGSAITMVTCIGFSLTVVSIQLLNKFAQQGMSDYLFLWLAPGPILGVIGFAPRATK
ncbi:MAG: MFS transporter [Bacteroidota bacterium]